MCKTFEIAKSTILEYIKKKEPFRYVEVQEEIISRGGVLRIAPGVTIGSYLRNLERRNIIYFNRITQKFDFVEHLNDLEENSFTKISNFHLSY